MGERLETTGFEAQAQRADELVDYTEKLNGLSTMELRKELLDQRAEELRLLGNLITASKNNNDEDWQTASRECEAAKKRCAAVQGLIESRTNSQ